MLKFVKFILILYILISVTACNRILSNIYEMDDKLIQNEKESGEYYQIEEEEEEEEEEDKVVRGTYWNNNQFSKTGHVPINNESTLIINQEIQLEDNFEFEFTKPPLSTLEIKVKNGSFENFGHEWENYDVIGETPYTLFTPSIESSFGVNLNPTHGDQYIGLVIRNNNTFEGVYQQLSNELIPEHNYEFKLDLAFSDQFYSPWPKTIQTMSYSNKAKLNIYIINLKNSSYYKIGELIPDTANNWSSEIVSFKSPCACDALLFTSDFLPEINHGSVYNGHILIDNVSDIFDIKKE